MVTNDINTFIDCLERVDDTYMEGEGEFYCKIHTGYPHSTYSCNHNLENGMCPRGFKR